MHLLRDNVSTSFLNTLSSIWSRQTNPRFDGWQFMMNVIGILILVDELENQISGAFSYQRTLAFAFCAAGVSIRLWNPALAVAITFITSMVVALGLNEGPLLFCWTLVQICLLSLALLRPRIEAIRAAGAILLGSALVALLPSGFWDYTTQASLLLTWTIASVSVGISTRVQREYTALTEARARDAVETRELMASRRVADERIRIARELHDVVAHHISVISIFTGLARTNLPHAPAEAEAALGRVQTASRSVLSEMQEILTVLRDPEVVPGAELEGPVPDFQQVASLFASFREIGLDVIVTSRGKSDPISATTRVAAYRVLQEALTNAHKHGTRTVDVFLDLQPVDLILTISNKIAPSARPRVEQGFGMIGMRERARGVKGSIEQSISNGTHTLIATLPRGVDLEMAGAYVIDDFSPDR